MNNDFGNIMKLLRYLNSETLSDMANKMGYTEETIKAIEDKKEKLPAGYLNKLFSLYKITEKNKQAFIDAYNNQLNLNVLQNYTFTDNLKTQIDKVSEEWLEFAWEVQQKDKKKQIQEGLDLITATLNYLKLIGLTNEHLQEHAEKLRRYKEIKYRRK